jgi:hypothetical protein
MSIRKPRSDSKLEALEDDQKHQLCEWLLTPGLNYAKIKTLVEMEFKVHTTGGSLSAFWYSYVAAYLTEKRARAVGLAKEVGEDLKRSPGQFNEATIAALEQKAFELANNPMIDPDSVHSVFTLLLKARDQELKSQDIAIKMRRLEALEKKEANTTQAKEQLTKIVASKGGLSADTLKQIEEAAKLL